MADLNGIQKDIAVQLDQDEENLKGANQKLEGAEEDVSKANKEMEKKNKTMTKGFW
jgi:peptidoglycan hydrolase CwlO-like protein